MIVLSISSTTMIARPKAPYTLSGKLSDFTMWYHIWRKNWVNCAVLTCNSAGLRIVLSTRLSHRELRSSLRESHSFLSLPTDTTMVSSQDTQLFKMNEREATLALILRFLFYFSSNIMTDVASKQQTTALFTCISTIVTRTSRQAELGGIDRPDGKPVLCQRTFI
jgi:hypothetical protein